MGANALTCAVRGGHVKTAQYLLDRGIEFDTVASPCELSAMFVACLLGHDSLLRLLTDRGLLTLLSIECLSQPVFQMIEMYFCNAVQLHKVVP